MPDAAPNLPARVTTPKQRAIELRQQQRGLVRRTGALTGLVCVVWLGVSIAVGVATGSGALVHAIWLMMVSVAVLLSPIALIFLRDINRRYKRERLALSEAQIEAGAPEHLRGALAGFWAETRVARLGVDDAVEPGEGVRLLWEWRRSFEGLGERERETLEELGVGLGPIATLLAGTENERSALSESELRDAAVHLGHVEDLLARPPASFYR